MMKLSTATLLLVEVEPLVCSRELNFSEVFLVLLVQYFDLYLSAMPELFRICTCCKIRKEKKHVSIPSTKDVDGNISI